MKISAVSAYQTYPLKNNISIRQLQANKTTNVYKPMASISFEGNPKKKPHQFAAFATESNYLGGRYVAGGLGDVADALPEQMVLHSENIIGKKADGRTFFPYYSYENSEGKIYVLKKESAKKVTNGEKLKRSEDFKLVDQNYKLQEGEDFALITFSKDGEQVDRWFKMKDLGLSGQVERMAKETFEMEKVPYRIFEIDTRGERKDRLYIIHTPEMAKGKTAYGVYSLHRDTTTNGTSAYGSSAYGSSAYGASTAYGGGMVTGKIGEDFDIQYQGREAGDMFFTEQIRAMEEALEKMDTDQHDNFNPQNILLHDRFAYVMLSDAAEKMAKGEEYWQGIRYAEIFHNIGRALQGAYINPIDFFKVIATRQDMENLKSNEKFETIKILSDKIAKGSATPEECTQVYLFFKPYLEQFIDTEGTFNMTMIPVAMTKEYAQNSVPGNVSKYFGKETRDITTEDIAKGLTAPLKSIEAETVDVVNGTKPANMETYKQNGFFGTGTLNSIFADINNPRHYIPYTTTDTPEQVYNAKKTNKENLINIIAEASTRLSEDKDAVAKVFFNETKMNAIRGEDKDLPLTLGSLSAYNDDILMISWGRPDPQKGLITTIRSFINVLKDDSIPLETRKKLKLILGAGGGDDAFRAGHPEWEAIQNAMKEIAEIEIDGQKGIFKDNALYINGLFPKRIANCADVADLTSRYEPCGITPLECFAAGTPVISIATGGAPDFITDGETGFLTEDPFMLSAAALGLTAAAGHEALDKARVERSAKQVAKKIKQYLEPLASGNFEEKQKGFIERTMKEKVEWHNNDKYNKGRSALDIYAKDKMRMQDNNVATEIKGNLRGKKFDTNAIQEVAEVGGSRKMGGGKKALVYGLVALAGAGIIYGITKVVKNKKTAQNDKKDGKNLSTVV